MRRILVTGSRKLTNMRLVADALATEMITYSGDEVTLVHGACKTGADSIAAKLWPCILAPVKPQEFWEVNGYPIEPHPAQWDDYGKVAGYLRNIVMVEAGADVCLAFFKDGVDCKGTTHCSDLAEKHGIRVMRFYEGADNRARVMME